MRARLAFVDDPARLEEVPEQFVVVAVEPSVAVAAETRGISAVPLDLHLDELELEELGARAHERVLDLCGSLDALVRGGASALWRFQELKTLYDGLLWRTLGTRRLVEEGGAEEALLLLRAGSLASLALPPTLAVLGVPTRTEPSAPAPAASAPPRASRAAAASIRLRRAFRRRRPRVLCLDEQYNIPPIAAALRERGADTLLWLPPPRPVGPVPIPDLSGLAPRFVLAGLDLWVAAAPALRRLLERGHAEDEAALRAARAAIGRDRPDLLLASTFAAPAAKAAAAAAREAGIPVVVSRHGELAIRALPVMVFNDLDVVDHALCWGEWEARFCERYARRPVCPTIVGAPMIEEGVARAPRRAEIRAELGLGDAERIALLAPTSLSGDEWFIGRRAPTDLAYVRHLIMVVERLFAIDGVRLVVKEHASGEGPLEAWARSQARPPVFVHKRPFVELIHLADALVLDLPSTTLVQALHGSARLYVVRHPLTAWEPGVLEHLERHGVSVAPAPELAARLGEDVVAGRVDGPASYPRAAREPLVASGAGTAAERAADVVMDICSEHAATTIVQR